MNDDYKRTIYGIEVEWAIDHRAEFLLFRNDYVAFYNRLHAFMAAESFVPEAVFTPIRIYNQYKKSPDEVQQLFIAGVWDGLKGNSPALPENVEL